jgi:hypothetical protein
MKPERLDMRRKVPRCLSMVRIQRKWHRGKKMEWVSGITVFSFEISLANYYSKYRSITLFFLPHKSNSVLALRNNQIIYLFGGCEFILKRSISESVKHNMQHRVVY